MLCMTLHPFVEDSSEETSETFLDCCCLYIVHFLRIEKHRYLLLHPNMDNLNSWTIQSPVETTSNLHNAVLQV